MTTQMAVELYVHNGQRENGICIRGYALEKYLEETGRLARALSLEEDARDWIEHPETYPDELKNKKLCLWKRRESRSGYRDVPILFWENNSVVVQWRSLDQGWLNCFPAALHPLE